MSRRKMTFFWNNSISVVRAPVSNELTFIFQNIIQHNLHIFIFIFVSGVDWIFNNRWEKYKIVSGAIKKKIVSALTNHKVYFHYSAALLQTRNQCIWFILRETLFFITLSNVLLRQEFNIHTIFVKYTYKK